MLERRDAFGQVRQRGIVGALNLNGTETGHVLRHEEVEEAEVHGQTHLLRQPGGTVEPLLLTAPDLGAFQQCVEETTERRPDSVRETPDGGAQRLWNCDAAWSEDPPALPPLLLADGHDRLEAARRLHRAAPDTMTGRVLAVVVDHGRYPLTLSATHRVVPGLDIGRAVRTAARFARVRPHPRSAPRTPPPGTFLLTGGSQIWAVSNIARDTLAGRLRSLPLEWVELDAAVSDHVLIPVLCEEQGIDPTPRYVKSPPAPGEAGLILPPPTWDQIWAGASSRTGMPRRSTCLGPTPVPGHILPAGHVPADVGMPSAPPALLWPVL